MWIPRTCSSCWDTFNSRLTYKLLLVADTVTELFHTLSLYILDQYGFIRKVRDKQEIQFRIEPYFLHLRSESPALYHRKSLSRPNHWSINPHETPHKVCHPPSKKSTTYIVRCGTTHPLRASHHGNNSLVPQLRRAQPSTPYVLTRLGSDLQIKKTLSTLLLPNNPAIHS